MRTVTGAHETLVSLEMNNASFGFDPFKGAAGGEPLELNHPICAAASSFFGEHKQILNWQTFLIYLLHLHWAVIWSLQALYSCRAHWFLLNGFDPTWNEGLGDLAGSERWGRVDGCRRCLLSCSTPGLSAPLHTLLKPRVYHLQSVTSECRAKRHQSKGKATEILSFSLTINLTTSAAQSICFFHSSSCDFDLETYFNLNNWSKILHSCQNSEHNGFLK